ncbi:hypothetical protein BDP27DRAFT_1363085 [Rhodocollybia butyracea]|uniref:C2H2-type domain-containing protein n=1 Tax=Rhodocollybia butyracea TaxID=206335 RepID=A0A9P5PWC8_9AGAR|nr:hypothetical protein BDP27DRAFT_1363085 [Rhodocollybia butyracea]
MRTLGDKCLLSMHDSFWSGHHEMPSGPNSEDTSRPVDKEDRYLYFEEFEPSTRAVHVGFIDSVDYTFTTLQDDRYGFTDWNPGHLAPPDSTSGMSEAAGSNTNSPVFGYSFPDQYDSSSCPTLAQALDLPPLVLGGSLLSGDTGGSTDSSVLPYYDSIWQSIYPASRAPQSPVLDGGAWEPPETPSNASMISRNSCQTLEDLTLAQPLLSVDKGDGKPIVGHGAHPTPGDTPVRRCKAKGRFECPIPHCGKSYTARHNLRGHIDRKHLGKMTPYNCEYCGKGFTGSRAHKRHMLNMNVCPTSPFARGDANKDSPARA